MNLGKNTVRGIVTAGALALATALVPATTSTAGELAQRPAAAAATTLVFDKNQQAPTNSRLLVYKGGKLQASYRAGSGLGVKNPCVTNKGWIPNGNWKIRSKTRSHNGRVIKGYAVHLEDMWCSPARKTKRTEMFIHSEMNRDGSQGRIESRRWDGPRDYRSNGCVKLHPNDIKKMFNLLDRIGWPSHLRVIS
ncbi:L,D-transpeptidase [Streptomyces thermoalcalitolerans]|uniref:L,D-TPase catalytic domain-containing protein n=1 Tax=Streptomyces thermoalcalitolerans TaxID=65605 RepID=A0ABN1ND01_9ACTN